MHTFIFSWCKLNSRQISCFCNKWKAACCTPPWSWSTKIGSVCLPGRNSNTENNSKTESSWNPWATKKMDNIKGGKGFGSTGSEDLKEKAEDCKCHHCSQHTNFYKRIKRREIALKQKEATIEQRERQCGQRRQRVEELKKKLKTSQTVVSNMRRRLSVYKTRVQANNERHDQQLVDYMTNDEEQPEVQTTVEGGKKQFTPAVVKAVIALISCGVSAKKKVVSYYRQWPSTCLAFTLLTRMCRPKGHHCVLQIRVISWQSSKLQRQWWKRSTLISTLMERPETIAST